MHFPNSIFRRRSTVQRLKDFRRERRAAEGLLVSLSESGDSDPVADRVLVDAGWFNPNYWIRYALLRRSLGLSRGEEIGVLGRHSKEESRETCSRFGFDRVVEMSRFGPSAQELTREARELLATVREPGDLLRLQLPHDFPPAPIYDGILKRQKKGRVDLDDPDLTEHLAEALNCIYSAFELVAKTRPGLLVLSHMIQFQWAALCWAGIKSGIPTLALHGHWSGLTQFVRLREESDIFKPYSVFPLEEVSGLSDARKEAFREVGRRYMQNRLEGRVDQIGPRYAYQLRKAKVTRREIQQQFGWDPDKPIMGFYSQTWADFPHHLGMERFRDFRDWVDASLEVILRSNHANWLLKSHPLEPWYGHGQFEEALPAELPPHVRLVDPAWEGRALIEALDGVVTHHGTAGLEFATCGKRTLVPDPGFYGRYGMVCLASSREDYLRKLGSEWWQELDVDRTQTHAEIFCGMFYCRPDWQTHFALKDDSEKFKIYATVPDLLERGREEIDKETELLRSWYESDEMYFHCYKMRRATGFIA